MSENINALNHCVGYGNPSAGYWFVSLEDGGGYCGREQKNNIDPKCIERELQRLEVYKKKFADRNFSTYYLSNEDFDNLKILQTYHAGRRTTYNKKFNVDSVVILLIN
jgi:hypothetical protein